MKAWIEMVKIVALNAQNLADWDKANTPFDLTGEIQPSLENGQWRIEETLFAQAKQTKFPAEQPDESYLTDPHKQLYFAYLDGAVVGQIRMYQNWNKFCYIENLAIKNGYRHNGIGHQLFSAAETWAHDQHLLGLQLEAQNDNLNACRFYQKQGMQLGGVDTLFYYGNPNINVALQWYKLFEK